MTAVMQTVKNMKTKNLIDHQWGGYGLTARFLCAPEALFLRQDELGLKPADLQFVLRVQVLKNRRTLPYAKNLGLDPKTVTAVKKRLLDAGYMEDHSETVIVGKKVSVRPDYTFNGLFKKLAELEGLHEPEPGPEKVGVPEPVAPAVPVERPAPATARSDIRSRFGGARLDGDAPAVAERAPQGEPQPVQSASMVTRCDWYAVEAICAEVGFVRADAEVYMSPEQWRVLHPPGRPGERNEFQPTREEVLAAIESVRARMTSAPRLYQRDPCHSLAPTEFVVPALGA